MTESSAPYTRAFEQYHGAHLTELFDGSRVSSPQLLATTQLPEVSASAGPWQYAYVPIAYGTQKSGLLVIARPDPGGPVDQLRITAGRWATQPGEIVLTHSFAQQISVSVGSYVKALSGPNPVALQVVGEVADIDEASAALFTPQFAWVHPEQLGALVSPGKQPGEMVVYRFHDATSDTALQRHSQEIAALLPPGQSVAPSPICS